MIGKKGILYENLEKLASYIKLRINIKITN
jgi:hypothetical protein